MGFDLETWQKILEIRKKLFAAPLIVILRFAALVVAVSTATKDFLIARGLLGFQCGIHR